MTPQELQAVSEDINRIITDTQTGKMKWAKTNPTIFIWRKITGNTAVAQLSLQKVIQRRTVMSAGVAGAPPRPTIETVENFIFQAIELPSGIPRLLINTEQDPGARQMLSNLFNAISSTIDREGRDFLKQILAP
jgi:hypothetical protein